MVFWASVALIVYIHAGYPLVLLFLKHMLGSDPTKKPIEPSVSLLVPAYNEAGVIEEKIRNSLELDYPASRLEVVIASDGSRDGTVALASAAADGERVRVLDYAANRGKISVLNDSMPQLRGDIVVFSDAATMLQRDAIRKLVSSFADPRVGAVSGVYRIRRPEGAELGVQEDLYWRYETTIKSLESSVSSILGAHGALYAIRKELYPFPSAGTINDDYVIPLRILQKGYRVVYERAAVAYEEAHESSGFGRRVRVMAGNLQQLKELRPLLRPVRPLPLFFFLSHKAGRLLVPFAMLAALASGLALADRSLYFAASVVQIGFYSLAAGGAVIRLKPRLLRLPYYICMINAAMFCALARRLTGTPLSWKH